jgi:hypothetical protein
LKSIEAGTFFFNQAASIRRRFAPISHRVRQDFLAERFTPVQSPSAFCAKQKPHFYPEGIA